jgi:hypothetical protein
MVVAIPPRNRSREHVAGGENSTQVQTAWVGGTTPLPRPFAVEVTAARPPAGLTLTLAGLWWDAKGDWTRAHESAQQDEGILSVAGTRTRSSDCRAGETALTSLPMSVIAIAIL